MRKNLVTAYEASRLLGMPYHRVLSLGLRRVAQGRHGGFLYRREDIERIRQQQPRKAGDV